MRFFNLSPSTLLINTAGIFTSFGSVAPTAILTRPSVQSASPLFLLYTIILLIFGVKDAVVIAFLCALLNLIPYIGPLIGIILMSFLTMTSYLGQDFSSVVIPKTIYVVIGYLIAQLIDNLLSQPYIFSSSVKSHPLEIFLVILTGGILFGVGGMILAIPSYTVIKVFLKVFFSENKLVKKLTKNL